MEAKARTLDWRPLAVLTAVVAIVLTIWASGAFAAGGSSGSTDSPASDVPSMFIQDDGAPSDNCPDGGSGGSGGSGADQGSGSGSSQL